MENIHTMLSAKLKTHQIYLYIVKNKQINTCYSVSEDMKKKEPPSTVGEDVNGVATMKTVWRLLNKLRTELLYDPDIHFMVF